MPTSLTSTYLIPAVLLNPVVVLHGLNTFCYHTLSYPIAVSTSQNRWLEKLGPPAAIPPSFDIHSNDQLCWGYTILMVFLQILAFGRVQDNRVQRKSARAAAKAEREQKLGREEEMKATGLTTTVTTNGHVSARNGSHDLSRNSTLEKCMNGQLSSIKPHHIISNGKTVIRETVESPPETSSEEETMI